MHVKHKRILFHQLFEDMAVQGYVDSRCLRSSDHIPWGTSGCG